MLIYKLYPLFGVVSKTKKIDLSYGQVKQLSNAKKFEIIKITQNKKKNISELSKELNLAFNKCSNYITDLEKENLVVKESEGKNVYVKSNLKFNTPSKQK